MGELCIVLNIVSCLIFVSLYKDCVVYNIVSCIKLKPDPPDDTPLPRGGRQGVCLRREGRVDGRACSKPWTWTYYVETGQGTATGLGCSFLLLFVDSPPRVISCFLLTDRHTEFFQFAQISQRSPPEGASLYLRIKKTILLTSTKWSACSKLPGIPVKNHI